jgi:hypothetical protein
MAMFCFRRGEIETCLPGAGDKNMAGQWAKNTDRRCLARSRALADSRNLFQSSRFPRTAPGARKKAELNARQKAWGVSGPVWNEEGSL